MELFTLLGISNEQRKRLSDAWAAFGARVFGFEGDASMELMDLYIQKTSGSDLMPPLEPAFGILAWPRYFARVDVDAEERALLEQRANRRLPPPMLCIDPPGDAPIEFYAKPSAALARLARLRRGEPGMENRHQQRLAKHWAYFASPGDWQEGWWDPSPYKVMMLRFDGVSENNQPSILDRFNDDPLPTPKVEKHWLDDED